MPLRNRVTPLGELVATPERGGVYGNRGCLHDAGGNVRRAWNGRRWIACRLEFKGWDRGPLLQPGRFTELFFLDEVTAFAAGHRPCALCRRSDYNRFCAIVADLHPDVHGADAVDEVLHAERVDAATGERRLWTAALETLPDGAIVLGDDGAPLLVDGPLLCRWTFGGYVDPQRRPARVAVTVVTPPMLVEVLRSGWSPDVPLVGKREATAYLEG